MLLCVLNLFLTVRLYPKLKSLFILVTTLERAHAYQVPTHYAYRTTFGTTPGLAEDNSYGYTGLLPS